MKWIRTIFRISAIFLMMALLANLILVFNPYFDPASVLHGLTNYMNNTKQSKRPPGNETAAGKTQEPQDKTVVPDKDNPPADEDGNREQARIDSKGGISGNRDEYYMTFGEITSMENADISDKLAGLSIMSKLSSDEIDEIWRLAEDGVTFPEISEIKGILEKKLAPEEVERLQEILDKYRKLANR